MVRGDYIHYGLPQNRPLVLAWSLTSFDSSTRSRGVGLWCGLGNAEVTLQNWSWAGPRGVTRDVWRADRGRIGGHGRANGVGLVWGGGLGTSYHGTGQERSSFKNPDHLSLIDTHRSDVSRGYPTAYSHTARYAVCSNRDRLVYGCRKRTHR